MKKTLTVLISLLVFASILCFSSLADDSIEPTPGETTEFCKPAGDANSDGKINLSDVSLILEYLAKWDVTVAEDQLDAVNDGNVDLKDVTAILKHVAKWSTVRLGHNDTLEIVTAATCKAQGEIKLTCTVCNQEETVITGTTSCKYDKRIDVEPTCGTIGLEIDVCVMCGEKIEKTLPATGKHQYRKIATTDPTCVVDGFDTFYCDVCCHTYDKKLPATGKHHTVHGICTICGKNNGSEYSKVYTVGQTWVVNGQWEFTVNSVKLHKLCNNVTNAIEGYTDEQVVIINYTYKNIGYNGPVLDLYINNIDFIVHDEYGDKASVYSCIGIKQAKAIKKGESCTAEEDFVLKNFSHGILLEVSQYVDDGSYKENATFVLKITE